MGNKLLESVFSIKNDAGKRHKIIRIAGIKLKIRNNLKEKIEEFKLMHDKSLYVGVPDNLTLQLCFNDNCNCKCKFCAAHAVEYNQRKVIPHKWLYEDMLELYPKTSNIVPTLGEITAIKEGYDYISFIHENYPDINVFIETNGIAFDEKWQKLSMDNLDRVNFSVNAINNEYFKKTVWEQDGVWDKVIEHLDGYIKKLDDNGLGLFRPSISSILNTSNYETVEEFIKFALRRKIQTIVFFFDTCENTLWDPNNPVKDMTAWKEAYIKLMEIERLMAGKVELGYKLFFPNQTFEGIEKKIYSQDLNDLKSKYKEISDLLEDIPYQADVYKAKKKIRNEKGKKPYSYYEEITNVCFHQTVYKGYSMCSNPWHHIRLFPSGKFDICAWRAIDQNIYDYIENNKINWKKVFNNKLYRRTRKEFKKYNYVGCMPCCPGANKYSAEKFNTLYPEY